ncbi:MAG: hypothetical protein IJS08_13655 [Victivallales bacterium]|nr:hypothetical protein [Victivallales bacterium]
MSIYFFRSLLCVALFCVLFALLQECLKPKYCDNVNNSTAMVDGFYALKKNSVDVLFLGGSQMAYAVAADQLGTDCGVIAYDFGANGQMPSTTLYYLRQAFKRQRPKLVLLEVGQMFDTNAPDDAYYAWNMSPMPFSMDKWRHLMQLSNGDWKASFMHLFPLLQYHSRWKELSRNDFRLPFVRREYASCGHLASPITQGVKLPEKALQGTDVQLPDANERCLLDMLRLCQERGSRLILFKAPSIEWQTPNIALESFTNEHSIQYWDFNANLEEIGLDFNSDFVDAMHINANGARRFSTCLAKRLKILLSESHI